ncbi:septum formation protein Maf [Clostridium sp. AF37-5AT]|jgi:septum formation protein|nr:MULTISPECIES: Maf family protein [unclassified Clostridium]RHO04819.1 septum formation protein Maf [Clostridium sp. AM22-16AC]RHO96304.1 septum formation protein Maf [Clostridium sp. AF37-5AT]RHS68640.1 septum formation protein Maf [Clostridium sp. AM45-5]RHV97724.1 septum formation protein Maf [Clostridium sp. OF09-10]
MGKSKIILASGSPRRKELLLQIGIVPEIIVSHVEEKITSDIPAEVVMSLAEQKAVDVAKEMPEGTVILGSDTVVAADGKILGKPKSHEEAYEMIRRLAGRSHQVYTGVCLVKKGPEGEADTVVSFYDETDVNVSPMTEKEIREYADSEEPMDKAGSYAVQGFFARYIDGLKGSYANVMGLPVHLVYQELKKLGAL